MGACTLPLYIIPIYNIEHTYNTLYIHNSQHREEAALTTYASLADDVVKAVQEQGQGQLWVAIAGGPASGKSTLTKELCKRLEQDKGLPTAVIPMDGYHYYKHELDAMPDPKALHARRGAHWTFNVSENIGGWNVCMRYGMNKKAGGTEQYFLLYVT